MLPTKKNVSREKRCGPGWLNIVIILNLFITLLSAVSCSLLPPKHGEVPNENSRLKALDEHAWICYERGLAYMDQSRYELARQQFSFAASSAVTRALYEDALDGMRRAEQIIRQQR